MIWDGRSSSCRTVLIATCPAASRWIDRADGNTLLLIPQELLEKLSALVPPPRLLIAIAATVIVLGVSAIGWGRDGLVLVALVTIPGLVAFGLALGFSNWLGVRTIASLANRPQSIAERLATPPVTATRRSCRRRARPWSTQGLEPTATAWLASSTTRARRGRWSPVHREVSSTWES